MFYKMAMKRAKSDTCLDNHEIARPNRMDDDRKNPLLNDVVIEHLFQVIPFNLEDFKNFRLVSKLFWKSSLRNWRGNAWLSVKPEEDTSIRPGVHLRIYLKMLEMSGDPFQLQERYHFRKYLFKNWNFKFDGSDNGNNLEVCFWVKFGPKMTHLKCSNSVFFTIEDFERIIFKYNPNLQFISLKSNQYKSGQPDSPDGVFYRDSPTVWKETLKPPLQEIRVKLTHVEISLELKRRRKRNFPMCWMYFFARAPNIKVLKLQNLSPELPNHGYTELIKMFQCIELLREKIGTQILARLQELDILSVRHSHIHGLPLTFTTHFRTLLFPLTSLALDIGYGKFSRPNNGGLHENIFKEILEMHSNTLQKLVVYRGFFPGEVDFDFPFGVHLPHLTELRIYGKICENLGFLEDFPNMKTLVLMDGGTPNDRAMAMLKDYDDFSLRYLYKKHPPSLRPIPRPLKDFFNEKTESMVLPKMEVFIASFRFWDCDGDFVKKLARVMPNLKKLGIGLNNCGFQMVCQKWKQLEALHINPFKVDEKGVLGIEDGKMYSRPNLTDLKRLKFFSTGQIIHSVGLSNDSAVHGLLVLPDLEKVVLEPTPMLRKDVLDKLLAKFQYIKPQIYTENGEESEGSEESSSDESDTDESELTEESSRDEVDTDESELTEGDED